MAITPFEPSQNNTHDQAAYCLYGVSCCQRRRLARAGHQAIDYSGRTTEKDMIRRGWPASLIAVERTEQCQGRRVHPRPGKRG